MSRGTADNRATADDALMRYADILDGRKRLATFGIKGASHDSDGNPADFLFYKNENGHLPPEIESAFTCACDELRKAGHSPTAEAIAKLHGQLAEQFAEAARSHYEAMLIFRECEAFQKRIDKDRAALQNVSAPAEPPTSDETAHALWAQTMEQRDDEAFNKLHKIYGDNLFFPYAPFHHAEHDFEESLESLEECFEQNAAVVRGIVKAGVRDIRGEQLEQIIAGIRLVNQAQAETKQAVVGVRDDVRELKPEIVRGANAAESADANAAAAKTAAEGAKVSAEGAEQVAKKTADEVKGLKPEVEAAHEAADDAKIAAEGAKRSAEGAIEAAYEAQTAAEGAKDITQDFFNSRPYDYECSTEMLADFLKQKGVGKCSRTIQYWENYLAQGKGRKVKSPDKYTLLTRQTIAGAKAWVEYYAAHEKSKCRARESYDEISARHNASRIADNAPKPRRGE